MGEKANQSAGRADRVPPVERLLLIGRFAGWVDKLPPKARTGVTVAIIGLTAAYIVSPLDFDWIPVAGWIDDATLGLVGALLATYTATRRRIFIQPLRFLEAGIRALAAGDS